MNKLIKLMFLSFIFIFGSNILAMHNNMDCNFVDKKIIGCHNYDKCNNEIKEPRLNPYTTLAKSVLSTAVTLGTYAGMNIAFSKIAKVKSYDERMIYKAGACFGGAIISAANFAFLEKHFEKLWQLESGFSKNFCFGLMVPNILGSVANLVSWIVFLGRQK